MSVEVTDNFELVGDEIKFEQAEAIKRDGTRLVRESNERVVVDCVGLQRANSVTVAVLLHWYREAGLANKPIVFVNLAEELRNIVSFSGLTQVLIPEN